MDVSPRRPQGGPAATTLRLLRMDPIKNPVEIIRTLSESYRGCMTHFVKGRSEYCPGPGDCDHHAIREVWKGYCSAEQWIQAGQLWVPVVLEISESLDQDFWGVFQRGQVWQLRYQGKKDKKKGGKVVGELWEQRDPFSFPEPYDMRPVLCSLYHVLEIKLHVDNPLPRRIVVKPSVGDAPVNPREKKANEPREPSPFAGRMVDEFKRRLHQGPNGQEGGAG